jgi:hypothetical protein
MTVAGRVLLWTTLFAAGAGLGGAGVHLWHEHRGQQLPPRRLEATVYLPRHADDGKPFPDGLWDEALSLLVKEFGGATLGPETEGCWLGADGNVRRERVRPVVVSFEPDRLPAFRRTLNEVGRVLGQEAMYVRFEEPRVEVLRVTR